MKHVILVEDDERLQSILARSLRARGHDVCSARFGSEARTLMEQHMPGVLILDINLPDETGWDVLRWLRQRTGAQPRVVVLTAFRPPQTRIDDLAPDAVLTKPFPIEALTRLVEAGAAEPAKGVAQGA
jgi:DNA-binding response OmpR family regulator